jgi:hypothetical protein
VRVRFTHRANTQVDSVLSGLKAGLGGPDDDDAFEDDAPPKKSAAKQHNKPHHAPAPVDFDDDPFAAIAKRDSASARDAPAPATAAAAAFKPAPNASGSASMLDDLFASAPAAASTGRAPSASFDVFGGASSTPTSSTGAAPANKAAVTPDMLAKLYAMSAPTTPAQMLTPAMAPTGPNCACAVCRVSW